MRTTTILATALLSGLVVRPSASQTPADSAPVTSFYGRWFGSATQGFSAYASFYATEGYILPPGAPPLAGRAAIAAWFEQTRAASPTPCGRRGSRSSRCGSWARSGSSTAARGQRVWKAGGDAVPFETKYSASEQDGPAAPALLTKPPAAPL